MSICIVFYCLFACFLRTLRPFSRLFVCKGVTCFFSFPFLFAPPRLREICLSRLCSTLPPSGTLHATRRTSVAPPNLSSFPGLHVKFADSKIGSVNDFELKKLDFGVTCH